MYPCGRSTRTRGGNRCWTMRIVEPMATASPAAMVTRSPGASATSRTRVLLALPRSSICSTSLMCRRAW